MFKRLGRVKARPAAASVCVLFTAGGGGGGVYGGGPTPPADTTPPTVSAVTPANASLRNPAGAMITVTFSEAVKCSTVTAGAITLLEASTPIPGTTTCSGSTATFTATSGLPTN